MTLPTIVLLHGSGHRAATWADVRDALDAPSVAVDLPGRSSRPADLGEASAATWAASVIADLTAETSGPIVLVGHSAAGTILPRVAAAFDGSVVHLVFVAGLIARHGDRVASSFYPEREPAMIRSLDELRDRWRGHSFVFPDEHPPPGFHALHELQPLMSLDSMVAMAEPVDWTGVPDEVPRTWVRCLRDRIQPTEIQAKLAANAAADEVLDIDCGHSPAVSRPIELAAMLDEIAARYSA